MTDHSIRQYHNYVTAQLARIVEREADNISRAAGAIANALINDRDFFTFGSGHSELVAREAMWRAGGLAPATAIYDHTGGDMERLEGVAELILGHYTLRPGGVMIVISNSGVNPVPIEAAQVARQAGLTTVAMTALAHSQAVPSRHSSGQKLYDVADIVIDTHTPRGDSALPLASGVKAGATSTLAGVFIMEAMTTEAAFIMEAKGVTPPVIVSANVPEGDAHNLDLKQRYLSRHARYVIDTADLKPDDPT
jgi:uncharacterized phosphosugar-binding protein